MITTFTLQPYNTNKPLTAMKCAGIIKIVFICQENLCIMIILYSLNYIYHRYNLRHKRDAFRRPASRWRLARSLYTTDNVLKHYSVVYRTLSQKVTATA